MYHKISLFIIEKKLKSHCFLSPMELADAMYNLEVLLINFEKIITIYFLAFIFQSIATTFIVHICYYSIRRFAGGWHANSSIRCTFISVIVFVFLPRIVHLVPISIENYVFMLFTISLLVTIWKYAPAGTDKRRNIDKIQCMKLRGKAMGVAVGLLILAYVIKSEDLRILILLGLSIEAITIHPKFYKLMKRGKK